MSKDSMRIVSIGNFYGVTWDGSISDEIHIANALEELGHEVLRIDRTENLPGIKHNLNGWDFFLFAQWDGYPSALTIDGIEKPLMDALRQSHSTFQESPPKMVYWAFDYQADGQEWHEQLVRRADLYLSKRIADSKYPNWQWLSQDFAPSFLTKAPEVEKDIDVLFTGSYLPWADERNETLKAVDEKFDLHIYSVNPAEWLSRGFKHVNGPVMDDALPSLIARAKVNLSIDHTIEAGYWSDRNSQIIACGGFVLFRYVPLSEAIFRSHVAYYWGITDVLDAIEYWLDRDEDRGVIAAEAYQNSEYHKATMRVNDMLNIVKGFV